MILASFNPRIEALVMASVLGSMWSLAAGAAATPAGAASASAAPPGIATPASAAPVLAAKPPLDRSGRPQTGKASFYADRYAGRVMADGTRMSLYSDNAASKTLPLGSTARVINLDSGLSAEVTIRDRGPYVEGRIIDLSPATARRIGLDRRRGLARVAVVPLTVPMPDGTVKIMPGAARMAANRP
jgi:rare lipoprotein A